MDPDFKKHPVRTYTSTHFKSGFISGLSMKQRNGIQNATKCIIILSKAHTVTPLHLLKQQTAMLMILGL